MQGGPAIAANPSSRLLRFWIKVPNTSSEVVDAEGRFRRALAVAREQQARFWELRAATSLARLWRNQDKRTEAHDLLAPIYNWFTEGFGTPVLQDAKALLDELA
jgi:predicted ATPase